jgi:Fe-S cluster assembly protein SufB
MTTAPESLTQEETLATLGRYDFGWADSDAAGSTARRGLSADVVADISALKNEPQWMLEFRLKALDIFERKPMPRWGADLSGIDFDNIKYFVRSTEKQAATWEELPADISKLISYQKHTISHEHFQRDVNTLVAQFSDVVSDSCGCQRV